MRGWDRIACQYLILRIWRDLMTLYTVFVACYIYLII